VQQIAHAEDAWDVAIGTSRILSDAGEVASTALGVAGAAEKGVTLVKDVKLAREMKAALATGTNAELGRAGEIAAERLANRAGYSSAGDLKINASGHGVDRGFSGRSVFTRQNKRAIVIEAKATRSMKGRPALKKAAGNVQGSVAYNVDRLSEAAKVGNESAGRFLSKYVNPDVTAGSYEFALEGPTGRTGLWELQGVTGAPTATAVPGLPKINTTNVMVGTATTSTTAHGGLKQ
jgi:adhesin HecA-like repeat protein